MKKILVAIVGCQAHYDRMHAQRNTWMAPTNMMYSDGKSYQFDVRFFVGGMGVDASLDAVIGLDVGDGYCDLPEKVRAIFQWALDNGYDGVFRADTDVYMRLERLTVPRADYAGRVRGPSMNHPAPYCSGFCYWLSRKAMQAVVDTPFDCVAEDCMVGNILHMHDIHPLDMGPYFVVATSGRSVVSSPDGPRSGNSIIASCEYKTLGEMQQAHADFLKPPTPQHNFPFDPELSKVDVLVKTFLRDGMLYRVLGDLNDHAPALRMILVDDGDQHTLLKTTMLEKARQRGHAVHLMPFDSGFGEKSNAAISFHERDYVLIGSDDFDFTTEAIGGIRKMVRFLYEYPEYGIVSGRVDHKPYEFDLLVDDVIQGDSALRICRETDPRPNEGGWIDCDLTVNFSLIRRELLGMDKLHWDGGKVKIGGGEHGAFFLDAKEMGIKVACLPEVNINQVPYFVNCQDPRYGGMRARAKWAGRPCLKKRGIDLYYCYGHKEPEVC